jgi:hypothetical protein
MTPKRAGARARTRATGNTDNALSVVARRDHSRNPYRVPLPAGSDVENAKYHHDDLAGMTGTELALERHCVISALVGGDGHLLVEHAWLEARFGAVVAEQSRRRPQAPTAKRPRTTPADEWRRPSFETMQGRQDECAAHGR